MTQQLPVK